MTGPSACPRRWVTALLWLIRDDERRELVAGDLEEGFHRRVESGVSEIGRAHV